MVLSRGRVSSNMAVETIIVIGAAAASPVVRNMVAWLGSAGIPRTVAQMMPEAALVTLLVSRRQAKRSLML